jgi:hypothetical protein
MDILACGRRRQVVWWWWKIGEGRGDVKAGEFLKDGEEASEG